MVPFAEQEGTLGSSRDTAGKLPDDLRLGVGDLDREHEAMFRTLDRAIAAAQAGDGAATCAALTELRDLFIRHVAEEERLMEESRYPDRARHRAAHELFLQDFAQLWSDFHEKRLDATALRLDVRVGEWLKFHIRVNDAPLAEHLAKREGGRAAEVPPARQPS